MTQQARSLGRALGAALAASLALAPLAPGAARAIPAFARQYEASCQTCHSAYPRLNAFGKAFVRMNYRLPNWKETTVASGDERLHLPKKVPLAVRAQAYMQVRQDEQIDVATGETLADATFDFQTPYQIKLLSSAPLSEHVSYYFYGLWAEKGENGTLRVEDAWVSHDDLFGTGVGMQLGQFQVSDLMFPREQRLPFQDYVVYRMADITYQRGILLTREAGPLDLAAGLVNGNGVGGSTGLNAAGIERPDRLFDRDTRKSAFGRVASQVAGVDVGLFGLWGKQRSATGFAAQDEGARDTRKAILGVDASGTVAGDFHWYAQVLWNRWDGFLDPAIGFDPGRDWQWWGGFVGVDWIASDEWVYSALLNYVDAGDFEGTDTIYEGLDMRTLSLTASHYMKRNLKLVIEANLDFQPTDSRSAPFVGHQSQEHYLLVGLDAAF